MDELHSIVHRIIQDGYLMSLATQDEGGLWVSDVIYVFDEAYAVYWLSREKARHSQAIITNSQVAGTITLSTSPKEPDMGLQIAGMAEKLDGDNLELAAKHRAKRGKETPGAEGEVMKPGESWYKLTPIKIEVIYSPKWGYQKQSFVL